jgi:V/A-type H+/Na+-transporting ATPase subunit F
MLGVAVIGSSEFILGFQMAGIRNTFEVDLDPYRKMKELMARDDIGIIITEEPLMKNLDEHDRNEIESSVKPVVIVLSEQASSESLRKMIRKSIGIDLWQ